MQARQLSRRDFLSLAGVLGGTTLLAACSPVAVEVDQPAAGSDNSAEASQPAAERTAVRVWIGGSYTPTEWTSRSAEHPIVVNAPRILAQRYEETHPGTEIVYEEGRAAKTTSPGSLRRQPRAQHRIWCGVHTISRSKTVGLNRWTNTWHSPTPTRPNTRHGTTSFTRRL